MRVGIDIGGTTIKIGLVNDTYEIVAKKVIPTESDVKTAGQVAQAMAEAGSTYQEILRWYYTGVEIGEYAGV